MWKKRGRGKVRSLKAVSLRMLIPVGIALAGLAVFLLLGMRENRRLQNEYVEDTAGLYVGQINRDIAQINSELIYIQRLNKDIRALPSRLRPGDAEYYALLQSITEQNRILKIRYAEVQFFYVYEQDADVLLTDAGTVFADSIKTEVCDALIRTLKEHAGDGLNATSWTMVTTPENTYIISWYTQKQKTMGCVINLDTIFETLQQRIEKYEVVPFMQDAKGELHLPERVPEAYEAAIETGESGRNAQQLFSFPFGSVGNLWLYVVPGSGMLERLMVFQILFVLMLFVLLGICILMAYSYYGEIMRPMREFVEALDNTDEEQLLNQNGANNILELEFASVKFRTLLRKIQSLKIAIYEKELMEQRAELEYVQEQVRPHFLLNCLSVIHGMADERDEREIVEITEVLADYMRYVMRDSKNQRVIKDELNHIDSYVRMQKLRYGEDAFTYEVVLDGEVEDCLVPPLLLQTLVENAIVHGVSLDRRIDISLYITREQYEDGCYLYISVSDTGGGFSQETLQALENDTPIIYNGRRHVGLQNVRRRLELMYEGRGGITFSNMGENYGAVVEVHMPMAVEKSGS